MDEKKNEIILFENEEVKLEVNLHDDTVWLTQEQMMQLFYLILGQILQYFLILHILDAASHL